MPTPRRLLFPLLGLRSVCFVCRLASRKGMRKPLPQHTFTTFPRSLQVPVQRMCFCIQTYTKSDSKGGAGYGARALNVGYGWRASAVFTACCCLDLPCSKATLGLQLLGVLMSGLQPARACQHQLLIAGSSCWRSACCTIHVWWAVESEGRHAAIVYAICVLHRVIGRCACHVRKVLLVKQAARWITVTSSTVALGRWLPAKLVAIGFWLVCTPQAM